MDTQNTEGSGAGALPGNEGPLAPRDDRREIEVTVTFSFSEKDPFRGLDDPVATVGMVRAEAMTHFGVEEDPGHLFYLSHDRQRQDDSRTLGEVAGHAHAVTFRLVKELIQG